MNWGDYYRNESEQFGGSFDSKPAELPIKESPHLPNTSRTVPSKAKKNLQDRLKTGYDKLGDEIDQMIAKRKALDEYKKKCPQDFKGKNDD